MMGIPTLTTYMKENGHIESVILKEMSSKIVIDGFCLCYKLFRGIKCRDYFEFYKKVFDFFGMLKSIGIEAYVVVDGIDYNNEKAKTNMKRLKRNLEELRRVESRIEMLTNNEIFVPPLAKKVFADSVCEAGVKFFVADGEADRDVVSLANHVGCPVLGYDSDFFIFNIDHGLILMPDNLEDLKREVRYFDCRKFDQTCNFSHPQIRLFLPFCLGNDFHGRHALPELGINREAKAELIVEKLSTSSLKIDDYQEKLASDLKFYGVVPRSFEDLSQHSAFSVSVPQWIVSRFKRGEFSRTAMYFLASDLLEGKKIWKYLLVVEDLKLESAWKVTDSVLPYVIGALFSCYQRDRIPSIVVKIRQDCFCAVVDEINLSLSPKHLNILGSHDLHTVHDDMSVQEREKIFLRTFHCKSVSKSLNNVPKELKLAVIASRCWLRFVDVQNVDYNVEAFISALVLCFQTCSGARPIDEAGHHREHPMARLRRVHYLAQWECMLHLTNSFNEILNYPFTYTSLGRMFSGTLFQSFFVSGPGVHTRLDFEGACMYEAITKKLLPTS